MRIKPKLNKAQEKRFDEKFDLLYAGGDTAGDPRNDELKQHLALELSKVEIWKNLEGYEGLYQVSALGRIKGYQRGERILKPAPDKWQSMTVVLAKNGKRRTLRLARLIAKTFVPNPKNKPEVNHIDGDRTNNRVDNLEWVTRSENEKHAYRTGLKSQRGESNFRSKLTKKDVLEIRSEYFKDREWLAKKYGVTVECIRRVIKRINWKHV